MISPYLRINELETHAVVLAFYVCDKDVEADRLDILIILSMGI